MAGQAAPVGEANVASNPIPHIARSGVGVSADRVLLARRGADARSRSQGHGKTASGRGARITGWRARFRGAARGRSEGDRTDARLPGGSCLRADRLPFASPFRYDGSPRRDDRFGGLHGGIDLTLEEGTPLLAVASGKVIAKGTGGRLEGIYLWLMHAPSDTGLPFWIYTKYQHLSALPVLNEGDTVRVGQVVASSGKTGTTGGHYGQAGYPHLHLGAVVGPSGEYMRVGAYGSMIRARDGNLSDPLILYLTELEDPASVASLPEDRKRVRVPVVSNDGTIHPPDRKVVWPTRCRHTGTN